MKKLSVLIIIVLVVLSGCQENKAIESYKRAMSKTSTILRQENMSEGLVEITSGEMSQEIRYHAQGKYNNENATYISQVYYEYDDLGQDIVYYQENLDKRYLYIDILGKYVDLSDVYQEQDAEANAEGLADVFKELNDKINSLLEDENVFRGENVLVQNEDGQVKATKYTITLNEVQLLEVSKLVVQGVMENKDQLLAYGNFNFDDDLSKWRISDFTMTSYVDFDDYIVSEEIKVTLTSGDIQVSLDNLTNLWHINQDLMMEFPEVSSEDWMEMDALNTIDQK